MTFTALPLTTAAWDEPEGIPARGTVVVLTGRGETAAAYGRLGRRLSADAYRVRVVEVDVDDLPATEARLRELMSDADLPAPRVLLGADSGATLAAGLLDALPVDAAVLAGLVLTGSQRPDAPRPDGSWEEELEARTACPAHRRVITEDPQFERGALARPLPAAWGGLAGTAPRKPVLVLHGALDPVTAAAEAIAPYLDAPSAQVRLVEGAHHDVLNDVMHRSVAAAVVQFLERLRLGADLPVIVREVR